MSVELHPDKTRIVYCKDTNRRGDSEHTSFDFLGFTFRGRLARGRHGYFVSFSPAMSAKAKKAKGKQIRDWHLKRRSDTDLSGLARENRPHVRGLLPLRVVLPERPALHLTIDNDGAVQSVDLQRWGNAGKKSFGYIPFGGDILAEKRFGDLVLPARLRVGWWHGTERFSPFFEAEIMSAVPNDHSGGTSRPRQQPT